MTGDVCLQHAAKSNDNNYRKFSEIQDTFLSMVDGGPCLQKITIKSEKPRFPNNINHCDCKIG